MRTRFQALALLLGSALSAGAQCTIDLPQDSVNVYLGYEPLSCTTLVPVVNAAQPYTIVWNNGLTTPTLMVCATVSQWVFVAVQDTTPCYATDSVYVNVVDVRCGENMDKVWICHVPPGNPGNAHSICIGAPAVSAHFAHGCSLGACNTIMAVPPSEEAQGYTVVVSLGPNPMSSTGTLRVVSLRPQHVRIRALDPMGRQVAELLNADLAANEDLRIPLDVRSFPPGMSAVWIESLGMTSGGYNR